MARIITMFSMFKEDLVQLSIFKNLSDAQFEQLEPMLEYVLLRPNQIVFEQSQFADYLYILLTGEVLVRYKPYDGPSITVARIVRGGVFGWSAALGRLAYTSSAVVSVAGEAYRIQGQKLRQLCEHNPETGVVLLERLANVIAERLHNAHTQIVNILSQGMDLTGGCEGKVDQG